MSSQEKLSFDYSVKAFEDDKVTMQLKFKNPEEVSRYTDRETLTIELVEFRDTNGDVICDGSQLNITIPNQLEEAEVATIKTAAVATVTVVGSQFTLNLII